RLNPRVPVRAVAPQPEGPPPPPRATAPPPLSRSIPGQPGSSPSRSAPRAEVDYPPTVTEADRGRSEGLGLDHVQPTGTIIRPCHGRPQARSSPSRGQPAGGSQAEKPTVTGADVAAELVGPAHRIPAIVAQALSAPVTVYPAPEKHPSRETGYDRA